ncbi:MAG: transglutaminase-like domain-containing protein, partial [Leptolyngbyaceae bacterium]|nr:transglutaminase-like domain-containing protein [Leptolyngbyaceae bacterium]
MLSSLARKQFEKAVKWSNANVDLAKAALYMAQEEYPEIDPEHYVAVLDQMAATIKPTLPDELYPLRVIHCINDYLYGELGFGGNESDYYDPDNSYLNRVIDRRTGIPITLSLVYLEIARRLGFPMVGINMPGHFLIRPDVNDMELFVDPFHKGEVLFQQDCQERLNQLFGEPVDMQPDFFEPVSPRLLLARMLRNLKVIYLKRDDWERALAAVDRILLLTPDALMEQRDRGL